MTTTYRTATTLDGWIADEHDSLDWLFVQHQDEAGEQGFTDFMAGVGAAVMGATTYEWVRAQLAEAGEPWPYAFPSWVLTHRDLPTVDGADVRFASGDVDGWWPAVQEAAGARDVWVVGGGELAAQVALAGRLDRVVVDIAPVTLGAGRPLFPRAVDLRLVEVHRNGDFVGATYDVVGPRA